MKTELLSIALVFCSFALCPGQNVAIRPLLAEPNHEFGAVAGCPTNWPVIVDRIGTNVVSPFPGRTILTEDQLLQLYQSIGPAFTNWHATVWANYQRTNAAAIDARRLALLNEQEALQSAIRRATNAVDFSAPTVLSNLVRLRQVELRLNAGP